MRTPCETATKVLRLCGMAAVTVTDVQSLGGGMVNHVETWVTDGSPGAVVCKRNDDPSDEGLHHESRALEWMRRHSELPVPEVHGVISGEAAAGRTYLVMEKLVGRNLAEARLTPAGLEAVHRQMAEHLGRLHEHRGELYGSAVGGEQQGRWLDWFAPRMKSNYRDASRWLSPGARSVVDRLLRDLPDWLPESHAPTLVHGDLWQTNIIVDDSDPEAPEVTGFIDGGALFADVEYELAYVQAFGMLDERFFRLYSQWHPLRDGFARRCRVYWLNTMLLHLWLFGPEYLEACERLAREVAGMMG